jgi:hypothetical protein
MWPWGDVALGRCGPGDVVLGMRSTLVEAIGERLGFRRPIKRPFTVNCDEAWPAAPQVPNRPQNPQVACPKPATRPAVHYGGAICGRAAGRETAQKADCLAMGQPRGVSRCNPSQ